MDSSATIKMTMGAEGQTMDVNMTMDIKATYITSENMVMSMTGKMSMLGQEMPVTAYYKEGVYYTETMGMKTKMETPLAEAQQMLSQNSAFSEIPADAFKSLDMKSVDDGYELTYVADGSKISELASSLMGSMGQETLPTEDMTINDISGTMTVNKDYVVTAQTMKLDMVMNVEGSEMTAVMEIDMKSNSTGDAVTVELPEDLDSYQDMSELTEGMEDIEAEETEEDAE